MLIISLLCGFSLAQATELAPRMTFDKYIFAEGVDPDARDLTRLIVKFYDEDEVRLNEGELVSHRSADLGMTHSFLQSHPEIALNLYMKRTSEAEYQERTARVEAKSGQDLVDLFSFHVFKLAEPADDPRALLAEILLAPEVEIAYYESIPFDALCTDIDQTTPNYVAGQTYHDPAPLGTDYDFAQALFGADVVDGSGTGTYTGIFETGMQTTHEDVTLGDIGTLGTPGYSNHGTAVMGILGACDDNNVGMLGYLADQRMRLYQRNDGSYGSTAEIYDEANSQLLAGEVTNSSWGYFSNPMPAGQSCPDNPGQNGTVPCEYDPGVKVAIQAGVADGIHYIIAAHNGCTDLDDVVFGDIFDWSTDTGSIIVGACESAVSGNGHDAISWTSYGSRLTSFCWGEDIYSTGYGSLFTGWGDSDEWYTNSFGGTSGASPIVGGCAGVLNNIWRSEHSGDNISPGTMRDWLQTYGTPNTAPATPIGVMPDLFGILAPELAPYTIGGWDDDLVVNNILGDHTIPANLTPLPSETYVANGWVNWSRFSSAAPARSHVYRDDVGLYSANNPDLGPFTFTFVNGVGHQFRGGNHYLKQILDLNDELAESNETNNTSVHMYVWDGINLAMDVPEPYTRAPLKNPEGVYYYAKDGFSNGGNYAGYWDAYGVMPAATGNYNVFLHSVAPNSTDGFTTYESYSSNTSLVDFVGCNNNQTGLGDWFSIINYDDNDDDYTVEADASADDHYLGSPPVTQELAISESIDAGEILDVFEMYLTAGEDVWFLLDVLSGDANLAVAIYGPEHDYFARLDYDWNFNSGGEGESEGGVFTPTSGGFHGVVISKHYRWELQENAEYDFYWGPPQGDLTHITRTGWDHELVARNDGTGATGVIPAILNEGASVADNGLINIGAGIYELGSNSCFFVDGPQTAVSGDFVINLNPRQETL